MDYTQKLPGSVTFLFGWYKRSTLISVLVLSVETGVHFYFNSELKKEAAFYSKDRAISNTRGYVLIKTLVFWYDLALLIIYMDVYGSTSVVPDFLSLSAVMLDQ